jgi:hypothetical protein
MNGPHRCFDGMCGADDCARCNPGGREDQDPREPDDDETDDAAEFGGMEEHEAL